MSVYVPVDLQQQIRKQFANCCAYCRTAENLTVAIFEFEHIVPLKVGGETVAANLCLACPTCNRHKATRQTLTDVVTGQTVLLFHPQNQRWDEHFTWDETATRLIGLTPSGRVTIAALNMNRDQLIRVRRMWVKLGEHPPIIE
jgi:hypothetical protein